MPYIPYEQPGRISAKVQTLIDMADVICRQYAADGYNLTLRQLFYQFVSRDLIPNKQSEYKRLGNAVSKGRMTGQIDWNHITDRGRNYAGQGGYSDPVSYLEANADGYYIDLWEDQPIHIEVWVEKQALEDVVRRAAGGLRVGHLACKGYMSQSEMWVAARRYLRKFEEGKERVVILHLGDHDPSGIHMTQDIEDRLFTFVGGQFPDRFPTAKEGVVNKGEFMERVSVRRIALNLDQVDEYQPPPNPAKTTDSRFRDYVEQYGYESWELDALEPAVLSDLIQDHIRLYRDDARYVAKVAQEREQAAMIQQAIDGLREQWEDDGE